MVNTATNRNGAWIKKGVYVERQADADPQSYYELNCVCVCTIVTSPQLSKDAQRIKYV